MLPTVLIIVAVAVLACVWTILNRTVQQIEDQEADLEQSSPDSTLRYRVPVGMDAASVLVNLHHQGYHVTSQYEHGETHLFIRKVTGLPNEREVIRALIQNAHTVDHDDFRPEPPVWRPTTVVFDDESTGVQPPRRPAH